MVFECLLRNLTTYVTSIVQRCFINVDESHIDRDPTRRYYGRWLKGEPATLWQYASSDGTLRSLIAALTLQGIQMDATVVITGGVTADIWYEKYFEPFLLPILEPYDARQLPNSVLFMDGWGGHIDHRVLDALEDKGTLFMRNAARNYRSAAVGALCMYVT